MSPFIMRIRLVDDTFVLLLKFNVECRISTYFSSCFIIIFLCILLCSSFSVSLLTLNQLYILKMLYINKLVNIVKHKIPACHVLKWIKSFWFMSDQRPADWGELDINLLQNYSRKIYFNIFLHIDLLFSLQHQFQHEAKKSVPSLRCLGEGAGDVKCKPRQWQV